MIGEIFPLLIGFLIIAIFLTSIEILNKKQFEHKKIGKDPNKSGLKLK